MDRMRPCEGCDTGSIPVRNAKCPVSLMDRMSVFETLDASSILARGAMNHRILYIGPERLERKAHEECDKRAKSRGFNCFWDLLDSVKYTQEWRELVLWMGQIGRKIVAESKLVP